MASLAPFALALGCTLAGHAQVPLPQRDRLRGRVLDLTGKPWRGAHVVLIATAGPESYFAPVVERLEVRPDARGRFEARVLADRCYSVWAYEDVDDIVYRVCSVAANRTQRALVVLREIARRQLRLPVKLTGFAAWQALGKPHAWVLSDSNGDVPGSVQKLAQRIEIGPDGTGRLPRVPPSSTQLQVLLETGVWPGRKHFDASYATYASTLAGLGGKDRIKALIDKMTIELQKPAVGRYIVKRDGQPVADARLILRWRDGVFTLGRTGLDGICTIASVRGTSSQRTQVGIGGHGMHVMQAARKLVEPGAEGPLPLNEIAVPDGYKLVARFVAGGLPCARMPLLIEVDQHPAGGLDFAPNLVLTGADGRLRLDPMAAKGRYTIRAYLTPAVVTRLQASKDAFLATTALVARGTMAGKDLDLGDIDLDRLVRVDFDVRSHDGSPARFPWLQLKGRGAGCSISKSFAISGDRRGRVRLLAPRGVSLRVDAAWNGGSVHDEIPALAADKDHYAAKLTGTMHRLVIGTVVRRGGVPVAGASVVAKPEKGNATLGSVRAWTDAHGRFEVSLATTSVYVLEATAGSTMLLSFGPVSVMPGDHVAREIKLEEAGR